MLITVPLDVMAQLDLELLAFSKEQEAFLPVAFTVLDMSSQHSFPAVNADEEAVVLCVKVCKPVNLVAELLSDLAGE